MRSILLRVYVASAITLPGKKNCDGALSLYSFEDFSSGYYSNSFYFYHYFNDFFL